MATQSHSSISRFAQSAFSKYARELHHYLLRRLRSPQDAEDVTQEIFMRLLRFDDTDFVRSPQAYLYGVASHVVREFRMRLENDRDHIAYDSEAVAARSEHTDQPAHDELGDRLNLERQLEVALDELPAGQRAVLLCIKRDGMSYEEAAKATRFTVYTVERYLFDALARLRARRWDR